MATSTPISDQKSARLESQTYTVGQLAELLQCSPRHVHRLRDRRAIPGEIRIGNCVRFAKPVIDHWLSEGGGR